MSQSLFVQGKTRALWTISTKKSLLWKFDNPTIKEDSFVSSILEKNPEISSYWDKEHLTMFLGTNDRERRVTVSYSLELLSTPTSSVPAGVQHGPRRGKSTERCYCWWRLPGSGDICRGKNVIAWRVLALSAFPNLSCAYSSYQAWVSFVIFLTEEKIRRKKELNLQCRIQASYLDSGRWHSIQIPGLEGECFIKEAIEGSNNNYSDR